MDLQQLRYFVAAAESGSMSRGAALRRVSQPTISQQLARLEESLGVRLFDRLGRGVALTDEGRALLPRAKHILAEAHDLETQLRRDVDEGAGRMAVGAIPTMAPYLLPGPVAALRAEFPRCEITVRESLTEHLIERLVDGDIDLAIVSAPIDHALVALEIIASEPLLVVTPSKHHLSGAGEISLADLRPLQRISLHEMH